MAKFMKFIGFVSVSSMIAKHLSFVWQFSSRPVEGAEAVFALVCAGWTILYGFRAKYWTINRPEYVVTGYREAVGAVAGGLGGRRSRVEFFNVLAGYLARQTKSLAILDAATCGEEEDERMPSWVPNWSREVSESAYNFATRVKKDEAIGAFCFTEDGKTLQLAGLSLGTVSITRQVDLDHLQSLWNGAFQKFLILPSEGKRLMVSALQIIRAIMCQTSSSTISEVDKELISISFGWIRVCLDLGLELLRAGGTTMVYSNHARAREMGFLKVGEAAMGDQLVFVPGCFHYLVLRRRRRQTTLNSSRWKLVGLVATATGTTQRRGYSKSEWAQLVKDGVVHKYTIE